MTSTRLTMWALAAAVLPIGLSPRPGQAQGTFHNNVFCYGGNGTTSFVSTMFSGHANSLERRFENAISTLGHKLPGYVTCRSEESEASLQRFKQHYLLISRLPLVVVEVASQGATSSARTPAAPSKAETPPAQKDAVRSAQEQMNKSVAVALADTLRNVPNMPDRRTVESPPAITTGYGPSRKEAWSQAMARTKSGKVATTHCLENTRTTFASNGQPKVAGKFWDCRVSYSCGETQRICAREPAAASKQ